MQVRFTAFDWKLEYKVGNMKEENVVELYDLGNQNEAGTNLSIRATPMKFHSRQCHQTIKTMPLNMEARKESHPPR